MQKLHLAAALENYQPFDAEETRFQAEMLNFLARHEHFYQRSNLTGHFTGSAWIVSPDQSRALLIHHKKLDRWLQPGGHADDADESLWHTARREALEECHLTKLLHDDADIFDLDIHRIPEKGAEPEHWHLDVRYRFVADPSDLTGFNAGEVNRLQWVDMAALLQDPAVGDSIARMARKCCS